MPRANGPHPPELQVGGAHSHRSLELLLDHDFVAPRKKEDRKERRTIGPDLVECLQALAAGDTDP